MLNNENYIELLECAVLSLLQSLAVDDFETIKIPIGTSKHPSFANGGYFVPYNLKEEIDKKRKTQSRD